MIFHPIDPVFDQNSEVLILGSFPSVKSREMQFFYAHPQNRFWRVLAAVFDCEVPETVAQKRAFLLRYRIALWDVIGSCTIAGSSDSSITDVVPNDLQPILDAAPIKRIFVNGKTAERCYIRYTEPVIGRKAIVLPSTSPANAACSLQRLIEQWSMIKM